MLKNEYKLRAGVYKVKTFRTTQLSADMAKRLPQLLAITTPIDANSDMRLRAWDENSTGRSTNR
jgi:hypothetical protein